MLKQDIIEILRESLTDEQDDFEILSHVADRIIEEVVLKELVEAVAKAITTYMEDE